jgi:hypothetical protein
LSQADIERQNPLLPNHTKGSKGFFVAVPVGFELYGAPLRQAKSIRDRLDLGDF